MNESLDALRREFAFVVSEALQWGDQDAYGHVNNATYFRYFENARIPMLGKLGFFGAPPLTVAPILHSTSCRFRRPMVYPDTIHIGARISVLEPDRFHIEHRIVSETHGVVVADGGSILVAFDYLKRAKGQVPEATRAAIANIFPKVRLISPGPR